jgi:hypothetical protein
MIRYCLASFLFFLSAWASAAVNLEWDKSIDGGVNGPDRAVDVAFDSAGNCYLLSERTFNATDKLDVVLTKYSPAGTQVWQKVLADRMDADDFAGRVVTTNLEVIYTAILTTGNGKTGFLTSLKQDGTQVFQRDLGRMDTIPGLAAPTPANIYVAGTAPYGISNQVLTFAYNGAGTKLGSNSWQAGLTATVDVDALKADGDGVVIAGTVDHGSEAFPYVLTYDKVCDERWHYVITDNIQASRETSLEIIGQNYYVGTTSNRWREASISRFDANGVRKWHNGFGVGGADTMFGPSTQGLGCPLIMFRTSAGWGAARFFPNSSLGVPIGPYGGTSNLLPSNIAFDGARILLCGLGGDGVPVVHAYHLSTKAESWDYSVAGSATSAKVAASPDGSVYVFGQRNTAGGNVFLTRLSQTIAVKSISLNQSSVFSGQTVKATVKLWESAPVGGTTFNMVSSDPSVTFQGGAVQKVNGGSDTCEVLLLFPPVATAKSVLVSAVGGGGIAQTTLQIKPPPIMSVGVSIEDNGQYFPIADGFGGDNRFFKISLAGKGPAGFAVAITQPAGFGLPSTLTVPAGKQDLFFPFKAPPTFSTFSATLKGSRNGITKSTVFKVKGVELKYLSIDQTTSSGTLPVEAGVAFDFVAVLEGIAPSNYTLAMSNSTGVITSSSILVPAGTKKGSKSFTAVMPATTVTGKLILNVNGKSLSQSLAVTRGAISSISVPSSIKSGSTNIVTVVIKRPAPTGGLKFQLSYLPGLSKLGLSSGEFTIGSGKTSVAIPVKPPNGTSAEGLLKASVNGYFERAKIVQITL